MKHLITLLLFFALSLAALCQSKPKVYTPPPMKGNLNCIYKPKYSATKRLQFYPFSIADTVKIVSFRVHGEERPIKKDSLLVDSLMEITTLNKADIDQLTNILYNNFYKRIPNYGILTQCFFPRNAVLFFDKNGKMKESVLLCFHCKNYEKSSQKIRLGDECDQKIEKIRQFFIAKGLHFGTDLSISQYPGENFGDRSVLAPEETE